MINVQISETRDKPYIDVELGDFRLEIRVQVVQFRSLNNRRVVATACKAAHCFGRNSLCGLCGFNIKNARFAILSTETSVWTASSRQGKFRLFLEHNSKGTGCAHATSTWAATLNFMENSARRVLFAGPFTKYVVNSHGIRKNRFGIHTWPSLDPGPPVLTRELVPTERDSKDFDEWLDVGSAQVTPKTKKNSWANRNLHGSRTESWISKRGESVRTKNTATNSHYVGKSNTVKGHFRSKQWFPNWSLGEESMMLCEKVKKIQQAGFQTLAPTFLRAQGNACRRVARGGKGGWQGGRNCPSGESLRGRQIVPSTFFNMMHLLPKDIMGAPNLLLAPGAT